MYKRQSLLRVTYILGCLSALSEVSHASYLSLDQVMSPCLSTLSEDSHVGQVGHTGCADSDFITV